LRETKKISIIAKAQKIMSKIVKKVRHLKNSTKPEKRPCLKEEKIRQNTAFLIISANTELKWYNIKNSRGDFVPKWQVCYF
jgi:hypothetical protein